MGKRLTSAVALLVIGGLCGLALTQTYDITRAPVEENRIRQAQALLSELLGREAPTDLVWQNDIANVCGEWQFARGASVGYAGPIEYLALLQQDRIKLRITRHQETPGIADFIDHRKDPYLPSLDNTLLSDWSQLDNISGATITHQALRQMADQASTKLTYQREQTSCEGTRG
jgi:Na+-translocating ferredoxin:NAD+ oxidoreductase RnfG subunit